jgi:peptidase E
MWAAVAARTYWLCGACMDSIKCCSRLGTRGWVLAGISAGAICWFEDGITDSFGMPYRALNDGLGLVRGACCPHYDGEKERRPALLRLIKRGFPSTLALDDGAAAHFVGMRFAEAVSSRPAARVYRVRLVDGKVIEAPIPTRYLGNCESFRRPASMHCYRSARSLPRRT